MLPQDLRFHSYKEAFREIHHPENSKLVGRYSFLGALDTQRLMYRETFTQGCDYIVGEIREYTGTQESIEAFYATQAVILDQDERKVSVRFIPMSTDGRLDRHGWGKYGPNGERLLGNLASSPFIRLDPSKSLYFVFIGKLVFQTSDIRCLFFQ